MPTSSKPVALALLVCVGCRDEEYGPRQEPTAENHAMELPGVLLAPAVVPSLFPPGFFASSAAIVSMATANNSAFTGVVFANGSDWGPQPLTMHSLTLDDPAFLDPRPHWVSEGSGYQTGVCAGNLDNKEGDDLVVTGLGDRYGEFGPVSTSRSVEVYTSTGDVRPRNSFSGPAKLDANAFFRAAGCAIHDVDGDGVAEVLVGDIGPKGFGRLYHRKAVDAPFTQVLSFGKTGVPVCNTGDSTPLAPGAVLIDEVNDDPFPDLVLVGKRVAVFLNTGEGDATQRYPQLASWCSSEEIGYSPSVEITKAPASSRKLLTVSKSCISVKDCKNTAWLVYDPANAAGTHWWRFDLPDGIVAGPALLTSIKHATGDDIPDLVGATSFNTKSKYTYGFALQIFPGQDEAPHKPAQEGIEWAPEYRPVASRLLSTNLLHKPCEDLFVISQHPAQPSAIFPEVGNCATQ